jgi:RNA polymerase sigma factor (sigma-70 family)
VDECLRGILTVTHEERLESYERLLAAAQGGNLQAREQIGAWMLSTAERYTAKTLGYGVSDLTRSSLLSQVILKLLRGNTIDRAPDLYYLIAAITQATRELIIDHYRRTQRRRGIEQALPRDLPWFQQVLQEQDIDERELDEALVELAEIHPRKAAVVHLRFFCEMTSAEVSSSLGVSKSTVESDLRLARAWLYRRLGGSEFFH